MCQLVEVDRHGGFFFFFRGDGGGEEGEDLFLYFLFVCLVYAAFSSYYPRIMGKGSTNPSLPAPFSLSFLYVRLGSRAPVPHR